VKKSENQDSMGKTNFFLSTMSFGPWVVWLLKKYRKNELETRFEQKFTTGLYRIRI
jgi:hypothetical protein